MRLTLTIALMLLCLNAGAQQLYTDRLTQRAPGRGHVTLTQSQAITNLVNGNKATAAAPSTAHADSETAEGDDSTTPVIHRTGQKVKMNGFRIQVYAGGNSRQSKQQAENAAYRVRSVLTGETIYTNFISPRWVCRVGDYRSYEEAYNALRSLKEAGGFSDAVIVKSKVQVYIDD